MDTERTTTKEHPMNPNCKRCGTALHNEPEPTDAVALCDGCFSAMLTYITGASTVHGSVLRNRTVRRLYAKVEDLTQRFPCDDDVTPQPVPVYDEVDRARQGGHPTDSVERSERFYRTNAGN